MKHREDGGGVSKLPSSLKEMKGPLVPVHWHWLTFPSPSHVAEIGSLVQWALRANGGKEMDLKDVESGALFRGMG